MRELTEKQRRFCDEYLIDCNGSAAAIRAGFSERTARKQACLLLDLPHIQAYIEKRRAELNKQLEDRFQISKERVLLELARVGFSDIRHFFNKDGGMKPITELTEDQAACLSSVKTHEEFEYDEEGKRVPAGFTKEVKVYDKVKALDSIARVMGYNAPTNSNHNVQGLSFLDFIKKVRK